MAGLRLSESTFRPLQHSLVNTMWAALTKKFEPIQSIPFSSFSSRPDALQRAPGCSCQSSRLSMQSLIPVSIFMAPGHSPAGCDC